MQVRIYPSAAHVAQAAATLIGAQIIQKPNCVLGLATGSTPVPTYENLVEMYKGGLLDFSKVISYNLDEYVGIDPKHPCSYHAFMQENLFDHVNICPENTHVPDGNAEDIDASAAAYDEAIVAAGGIDLQLLGIGHNAHIGFNEPNDHFVYGCHKVDLSESTIDANKRFFDSIDDVPRSAVSLGIGTIMNAKQVLLLATGADKAEAIRRALEEDVSPLWQASILRTHPNVVFMLDEGAASKLTKR